jgi:methionine sulfoxide reductase heme-binding subunit
MLLGIKTKTELLLRHLLVAVIAALAVYVGWQVNAEWEPDMRLWKAFGVGAFFLIWVAAVVGPAAKLWPALTRFITWRREFGIWFTIVALVHFYLIWDGWAQWDVRELLGYEYVPELDMYLRFEPGFGLANLMGLVALLFAIILAATSFDRAVSFLGISSWKWLHSFMYVIFYIVALHSVYFAFIHYTPSPHRILMGLPAMYPANLLRFVYLAMILSVFAGQTAAFFRTVRRQRTLAGMQAEGGHGSSDEERSRVPGEA